MVRAALLGAAGDVARRVVADLRDERGGRRAGGAHVRGAALLVGLDALDAEPAQDFVGAGEQAQALEQAVGHERQERR